MNIQKKTYILIGLLLVLTLVFESINIFLSNRLSSNSIQAAQMQKQIDVLNAQNTALKTEVLSYSSFESVASRAAQIGYTYTRQYMSLAAPLEVAKR